MIRFEEPNRTHSAFSRNPSVATTLVVNKSSALPCIEIALKNPACTNTALTLFDVAPNAITSLATPACFPDAAFPQQGHVRSWASEDPSAR